MRILGVDPGDQRIGIALSDPGETIASPLTVLRHVSRMLDAAAIAQIARDHQVELILVGQSLDEDGSPTPQGRKAGRLAEAIRGQTQVPVEMWDEYGSTQMVRGARIRMGTARNMRKGHMDEHAAAAILQSYLDHKAGINIDEYE